VSHGLVSADGAPSAFLATIATDRMRLFDARSFTPAAGTDIKTLQWFNDGGIAFAIDAG